MSRSSVPAPPQPPTLTASVQRGTRYILAGAIAAALRTSLPVFFVPLAAALSIVTCPSSLQAQAPASTKVNTTSGTVFVFGYAAGALSDNFSVRVDGKIFSAVKGSIKIDLPIGTHDLAIYRGEELAFSMPVNFDNEYKRSLLLTLDKPGSVDYVLQDSVSSDVLDSGTKILPGMEASIGGAVIIQPAEGGDGVAKPLVNALVRLENTDHYAVTDAQGKFKFSDLAAGQYTLVFVAPENFDPIAPITFTLAPKESAERPVSIAEILETLSEIKVTATGVSQQTQATEEERASAQVAEVINAEQMKRGGDSEASGALKRVTGLSVVGGKFIYVRGMGERYSSVLLNGAQIPSPDPTRRVVPLDLFPVEVLDSVVVQKSYSADMPGEFGGGTVMLRTKEAGRKPFFKISAGTSFQAGTTFKDGLRHNGGNRDWLGFDRVRGLPNAVSNLTDGRPLSQNTPPAQLETAGEALAQLGFDTRREKIAPNGNFGAAGGGSFAFSESTQLSLLGAMRITNTWESNEELRRRYATADGRTLFANSAATRNVTDRLGTLTGFLNATLTFGEGQRIQATSMLLRQSSDQTQIEDGFKDSLTDIARDTELEWNENSLISNQLSGENYFSNFNDLSLTWQITDARAARESPAKRSYTYFNSQGQYFFLPTTGGNQIAYEDLDDSSREYRFGASMPWNASENSAVTFSAGIGRLERDRQSDLRRFLFSPNSNSVITPDVLRRPLNDILTPQNIGPNGFQLVEVTRTLDNYVGSQSLDSVFVNADWMFGEHWRFVGGVRRENNDQFISTFDIATPNLGRVNATSKAVKWLPALATTYSFAKGQQQLRFSYGRSVSRPDFREYSPAPFLDPILDIESFGNAKLKPTGINNFDLRWERYFDGDESVSAALFYKEFDLPIERVSVAGTGGLLSYENAESARNIGIELEGFLRLGRVNDALQDFFISANTSVLQSTVKLGAAGSAQTTQSRPLQGQSKYLVNMQLGYKPDDGKWEATGLYNVAGRRIAQVSSFPLPDIYETPFHQLDFTARYRFADEWTMGFRLKNLLDQSVEYTQGGLPTRRYKSGREFGFSIEWAPEFR